MNYSSFQVSLISFLFGRQNFDVRSSEQNSSDDKFVTSKQYGISDDWVCE